METAVGRNNQACFFITFLCGVFYKIYIKTSQIMNEADVKKSVIVVWLVIFPLIFAEV